MLKLMDCVAGMKEIADNSIDIIIADPPYNIGKDFGNGMGKMDLPSYIAWCMSWIIECKRVLKKTGTLYIYGYSEILSYLQVSINPIETPKEHLNVRWVIWHYTNKTSPGAQFWQRSHEAILVVTKTKKPQFNRDLIREPYSDSFKKLSGKPRASTSGRFGESKDTIYKAHDLGALPRDVIKDCPALAGGAGKKERVQHPTQKPLSICKKLLLASKQENECKVLVPFCGSGSEILACEMLDLDYISFETNETYYNLAKQRILEFKKE